MLVFEVLPQSLPQRSLKECARLRAHYGKPVIFYSGFLLLNDQSFHPGERFPSEKNGKSSGGGCWCYVVVSEDANRTFVVLDVFFMKPLFFGVPAFMKKMFF